MRQFGTHPRALMCVFKNACIFEYLVHSDQKQPVLSLATFATSLIYYLLDASTKLVLTHLLSNLPHKTGYYYYYQMMIKDLCTFN